MKKLSLFIVLTLLLSYVPLDSNQYQAKANSETPKGYIEGEVLVKFKEDLSQLRFSKSAGVEIDPVTDNIAKISAQNLDTEQLIQQFEKMEQVEIVEPNYIRRATAVFVAPNDPYFQYQWALQNTGQELNGADIEGLDPSGTPGADIDWAGFKELEGLQFDNEVIIAIPDSGINYNHEDISVNNLWDGSAGCKNDKNQIIPEGCPNHGWNFLQSDGEVANDPIDYDGHGTFISGIISATPNNNKGITGITSFTPNIKLMSLKFMKERTGFLANALKSYNFAKNNGAKIINASFGGENPSEIEKDFIDNFDGLFIAAAGNEELNLDLPENSFYPANYDSPNLISVIATDENDQLSSFSNYGITTTHIAAPGSLILSTCGKHSLVPEKNCLLSNNGYIYGDGTSYATPIIAATAALVWSNNPDLTPIEVKNLIFQTGTSLPVLADKTSTGKRLNLKNLFVQDINLQGIITGVTQATDGSGKVEVKFKLQDKLTGLAVKLKNLQYSFDDFNTTHNILSTSNSLSTAWSDNNYLTQTNSFSNEYSFTINTKHPDLNFQNEDTLELLNSIKIRFDIYHALTKQDTTITSDKFSIDLIPPVGELVLSNLPENGSQNLKLKIKVEASIPEIQEQEDAPIEDSDITQFQYSITGYNEDNLSQQQAIGSEIQANLTKTGVTTLTILAQDNFGNSQEAYTYTWEIQAVPRGGGSSGGGGGGGGSSSISTSPTPQAELPISPKMDTPNITEDLDNQIRRSAAQFKDTANHWAIDYITELYELGVVSGKSDSNFAPDDFITRAELTKIAILAFKYQILNIEKSSFTDIIASDWFYEFINTAFINNIIAGYTDNTFKPNDNINRAEALKIILTASRLNLDNTTSSNSIPFTDITSSDWFYGFINYAFQNKIVSGKTSTTFEPASPITRAEASKIIIETLKLLK